MNTPTSTKVRLVVFDLDGVLFSSKDLHYVALNRALEVVGPEYVINYEDHLAHFDGLPTKTKLDKLTAERGLPVSKHGMIWDLKQQKTFEVIADTFQPDVRLRAVLQGLKDAGYLIYCGSNSIYKTIELMLRKKKVLDLFDAIISCEDVTQPKPSPAIYLCACLRAGVSPKETIILEDSQVGRKSALLSGCHLLPVDVPENVTLKSILNAIDAINRSQENQVMRVKWRSPLNVVIPMNKRVTRVERSTFESCVGSESGPRVTTKEDLTTTCPSYLALVNGYPVLQLAVESLHVDANFIFVVPRRDYEEFHLKYLLAVLKPNCKVLVAEEETLGQAASVLLAKQYINDSTPLLIANCTQLLDWDSHTFLYLMDEPGVKGGIATVVRSDPRYSYVNVDEKGWIVDVAEKRVISDIATAGVYYWRSGSDFVKYSEEMMRDPKNMVDGAFYVSTAYKGAINDGMHFKAVPCNGYWPLGFPEDVEAYLKQTNTEE
ncbi:hypothetical protein SpCBS45565_g05741 [Spizellomyces sp. 'palustris']|nr:hypothetical protein SpCBS45565_g05741 [Spizellomyces sp. 'palustris']